MTKLLGQQSLSLSIDGKKFNLDQIKLDFKTFDPTTLHYRTFEKFQLFFRSPTFLRQQNISFLLPDPARFLMSSFEKLQQL